jgi:hypothetical protein
LSLVLFRIGLTLHWISVPATIFWTTRLLKDIEILGLAAFIFLLFCIWRVFFDDELSKFEKILGSLCGLYFIIFLNGWLYIASGGVSAVVMLVPLICGMIVCWMLGGKLTIFPWKQCQERGNQLNL